MSEDKDYEFSPEVQKRFLSLFVYDTEALLLAIQFVKSEFFDDVAHKVFFKYLVQYYETYEKIPSQDIFKDYLKNNVDVFDMRTLDEEVLNKLCDDVYENKNDLEYLKDRIRDFARLQARLKAVVNCYDLVKNNKIEEIDEIWEEAQNVGRVEYDIGLEYFKTTGEEIDEKLEKVPTFIRALDSKYVLNGGLAKGELGLVLAPTGGGKSSVLISLARGAVWSGAKVMFYSIEMNQYRVTERFDRAFDIADSDGRFENWEEEFIRIQAFGGDLILKKYPTHEVNIRDIKAHLAYIERMMDFVPDIIIVDSGDLMSPLRKRKDDWLEMGETYASLRNLAETRNCVVWSAAQSKRSASESVKNVDAKKKVLSMEDVGRSYEIVMRADFVVSIAQDEIERKYNKARLFIAKNRNMRAEYTIYCTLNFDDMTFVADEQKPGEKKKENKSEK